MGFRSSANGNFGSQRDNHLRTIYYDLQPLRAFLGGFFVENGCVFANDIDNWGGGYIVIGVNEINGRPHYPLQGVPIDTIDSYLKDMTAKFKLLRPAYIPIVEVDDYENKNLS